MITSYRLGYNGRIGNSLFQFAALYGLSKMKGYEIGIPYENENLGGDYYNHVTGERGSRFLLRKMFKDFNFPPVNNTKITYQYKEDQFSFNEVFFGLPDGVSIDGYFQTERYFEHCKEDLRRVFSFKDEYYEYCTNNLPSGNKIAINVRRGDYAILQDGVLPMCEESYFRNALKFFDKDVVKVFISDDIEWCKETFKDLTNTFFFDPPFDIKPYVDMCAISLCDGAIISNSSYSWWGAWLIGDHANVIAPKIWFGHRLTHYNTKDLIPNRWKIL